MNVGSECQILMSDLAGDIVAEGLCSFQKECMGALQLEAHACN